MLHNANNNEQYNKDLEVALALSRASWDKEEKQRKYLQDLYDRQKEIAFEKAREMGILNELHTEEFHFKLDKLDLNTKIEGSSADIGCKSFPQIYAIQPPPKSTRRNHSQFPLNNSDLISLTTENNLLKKKDLLHFSDPSNSNITLSQSTLQDKNDDKYLPLNTIYKKSDSNFLSNNINLKSCSTNASFQNQVPIEKDLIDLSYCEDKRKSEKENFLVFFDPLYIKASNDDVIESDHVFILEKELENVVNEIDWNDINNISEHSYYEIYDPFQFMENIGLKSEENIYKCLNVYENKVDIPPPLPKKTFSVRNLTENNNFQSILKISENSFKIEVRARQLAEVDREVQDKYNWSDEKTNPGLVISSTSDFTMKCKCQLILKIQFGQNSSIIQISCDIVKDAIYEALSQLNLSHSSVEDYFFQVWGRSEYFSPTSHLKDYDYVQQCFHAQQDVRLRLVSVKDIEYSFLRSKNDDIQSSNLSPNIIFPVGHQDMLLQSLLIYLETYEKEIQRLRNGHVPVYSVIQTVKAICTLLGFIETKEISTAIENLFAICDFIKHAKNQNVKNLEQPSLAKLDDLQSCDPVFVGLQEKMDTELIRLTDSLRHLIVAYCNSYNVNFFLPSAELKNACELNLNSIVDILQIRIDSIHRIQFLGQYELFGIQVALYHGTKILTGGSVQTVPQAVHSSFYDRIVFDECLKFPEVSISLLPRECRLVFSLIGLNNSEIELLQTELAWASMQIMNCDGQMYCGTFILEFWPLECDKCLGPAPPLGLRPSKPLACLVIEFPSFDGVITFPSVPDNHDYVHDFESLDENTKQQLLDIVERDPYIWIRPEEREVLWEKRHYLSEFPQALPKILLSAHSWDWACLKDLHGMIRSWTALSPFSSLQLLLPW